MSAFRLHRDRAGWNIGWYPTDNDDYWQFSLCRVKGTAVFFDVCWGARNDWRVRWKERDFHPLLSERRGREVWREVGRLGARNYAE